MHGNLWRMHAGRRTPEVSQHVPVWPRLRRLELPRAGGVHAAAASLHLFTDVTPH